ncbi:MAG TPA: SMP-30/gluconolactonase/LRE family protein [Bryobacteraceae bacterium]|jgi:gluconolactonase
MKYGCSCASLLLVLSTLLLGEDPSNFVTERLAAGYRFTEGPAWSKDGFLIFSDTPNDQLLKWVPGRKVELLRQNANGASGNAFDAQGRLYTCETRTRRVTRTDKNGVVEVIADGWQGKRLNAPAGIAVSKSGHVYFTDPAFGHQSDERELDFYGVYHIPPKGPIEVVARPAGRPHGIVLSPNGRTLYVSNADEHNVRAYDVDRSGAVSNERVLISKISGVPAGLCVDEKGKLYVAANGIGIYTPQGQLEHTIEMTDPVSACAVVDVEPLTIFATSRGTVYRVHPAEE